MSRQDILSIYEQGPDAVVALVESLVARIEQQEQRIARLEERLGLNSSNSSKPPSSDSPFTPPTRAERRASKRKPGGQKGHPGSTLRRVETPDRIITHRPASCTACGNSLEGVDVCSVEQSGPQVFDIPPIAIEVSEHRRASCRCQCGHVSRGTYPAEVRATTQYGPAILAFGLLLNLGHHVPLARTRQILSDLCGAAPCEAVLLTALQRLADASQPAYEAIIDLLLDSPQLHADESGANVNGRLFWVHVICSAQAVLYAIDAHRGREGIDAIGILPCYGSGQLMHDFWSPYQSLPVASHGYCVAHLLRELARLSERGDGRSHRWAEELGDVLSRAVHARNQACENGLSAVGEPTRRYLMRRYRSWLTRGERLFGDAGSGSDERNLLRRLRRHEQEILAFLHDVTLEPTNNRAERDIRMTKLREKISGCFRNQATAQLWMMCRSYIATARKQGHTFLEAIEGALRGAPIMPVAMR